MATKVIREPPLPRKVWVESYEFGMKLVPANDPILDDNTGMTVTEEGKKCIYISDALEIRHRLEIVLHEITHAINWVHDIGDGGDDEDMVMMDEEDLAAKHGRAWSAFFLDNPRFQRWLTYTLNRIRKERADGA